MTLGLEILVPDAVVLDTRVTGVQAADATGRFGLRPGHEPFVTVLAPSLLVYTDETGTERYAAVDGGVLLLEGDRVSVVTREAVLADRLEDVAERAAAILDVRRRRSDRPRPSSTNSRPPSRNNWPAWEAIMTTPPPDDDEFVREVGKQADRRRKRPRSGRLAGARPGRDGRLDGRAAGGRRGVPRPVDRRAVRDRDLLDALAPDRRADDRLHGGVAGDEPGVARMNWAAAASTGFGLGLAYFGGLWPASAGSDPGGRRGRFALGRIGPARAGRGHVLRPADDGRHRRRCSRDWSGCWPPDGISFGRSEGSPMAGERIDPARPVPGRAGGSHGHRGLHAGRVGRAWSASRCSPGGGCGRGRTRGPSPPSSWSNTWKA